MDYTIAKNKNLEFISQPIWMRAKVFQDGDALLLVELQQKLNAQNKNVTRLEEENLKLQKSLEEFTKITKTKKRRLEDDAEQDETNRLKEKIKILELRLEEREEELMNCARKWQSQNGRITKIKPTKQLMKENPQVKVKILRF